MKNNCSETDYRLDTLSYLNANTALVVFLVVHPHSFENILTTWIPEIKHYCPNTSITLMGNKTDLRCDSHTLENRIVYNRQSSQLK